MEEKQDQAKDQMLQWWRRLATYMVSLLLREYPYLHKMDNLCIDFKKKTVKYEQDQKRFNILRSRAGKNGEYTLDEESLKKLSEIIAKHQLKEESISEKVESLQTEIKNLESSFRSQHEELKRMLEECLKKP